MPPAFRLLPTIGAPMLQLTFTALTGASGGKVGTLVYVRIGVGVPAFGMMTCGVQAVNNTRVRIRVDRSFIRFLWRIGAFLK
jgi:hypothetical protein